MTIDASLSSKELREARSRLNDLCASHHASVEAFAAKTGGPWFVINIGEKEDDDADETTIHHLSSTATCLESLQELGPLSGSTHDSEKDERFARQALTLPHEKWRSERGADTYCRVRVLPLVLEAASAADIAETRAVIGEHLESIWETVGTAPDSQGVVEHPIRREGGDEPGPSYPPNAFLTYWAIHALRAAAANGVAGVEAFQAKQEIALLWARQMLGHQVALARADSEDADPQQLAWAITTTAMYGDKGQLRQPASIDLLRAGLAAFFEQQQQNGSWPRGDPLFHYPRSGNAYCFVFETLTALLRVALFADASNHLRALLRPYSDSLLRAAEFADTTKEDLGVPGAVGWCSRHHPHRTQPESWATGMTFSYLEQLRNLVGDWSAEDAQRALSARVARPAKPVKAEQLLAERSRTWPLDGWSVGDRIGALFLNPMLCCESSSSSQDADSPLIREDQARSAILFGPSGTSKTTVVEALAGAVGWQFVEVHASDFLVHGMTNVPGRADEVFSLIMELDHCVVLFDEIDELLRSRGEGSDPFGRFLTTSMLPKLAKLWDQRRVLFFVNTNLIDVADPAIRRSQRFDAALFVTPPDITGKQERLKSLVGEEVRKLLTREAIEVRLDGSEEENLALGWLALLRHDQMPELEARLRRGGLPADTTALTAALAQLGRQLAASDWHPPRDEKDEKQGDEAGTGEGDRETIDAHQAFRRFRSLRTYERLDFRASQMLRVNGPVESVPTGGFELVEQKNEATFFRIPVDLATPPEELEGDGWRARPVGLMRYELE